MVGPKRVKTLTQEKKQESFVFYTNLDLEIRLLLFAFGLLALGFYTFHWPDFVYWSFVSSEFETNAQFTYKSSRKAPNFVIMMADDMGWGDWSRTGAPVFTPHLENMSRSQHAVWFQRAYSGNPVCSPTRASLVTGRTPARSCIEMVEQHILCHGNNVGGCRGSEYGLANATRDTGDGYISGFYGKWHLGSLSDRGLHSPDCYKREKHENCIVGYKGDLREQGLCCFGNDGHLDVSHPLHFGFDEFVATPGCAASATSNCGCFFHPKPHNTSYCELGHYGKGKSVPYNPCSQYYRGNTTSEGNIQYLEPLDYVTSVDDNDFLVDQFENLLTRSIKADRPFLAVLFFHGVHIPYIATPQIREKYAKLGFDENEQDYWGSISQIDAAIGRVRSLLRRFGVESNTWVSITSDNGPEVNQIGGNTTNPGRTGGLRGRKRDATDGGTRVIGIVEYPPVIATNRIETEFPIVTMDIMPTVLELVGMKSYRERSLDGISLLPVLRGEQKTRPMEAGIGIHSHFQFGQTNKILDPKTGKYFLPFRCPNDSDSVRLGDVPTNFTLATHGWQFSWAEGNHLKIYGCKSSCLDSKYCNNDGKPGWHFFLYNITEDRREETDLWSEMRDEANAMLRRFIRWQGSVVYSQKTEAGCLI